MGFLKKLGASLGHVDQDLLENGLLARGTVTECRRTSVSTGNQVPSVVCDLTVQVELPNQPAYTAQCKHPIQMPYLPQFESGQAVVAVRVDPNDQTRIALDLAHDVPRPGGVDVAQQLAAAGINLDPQTQAQFQ